MRRHRPLKLPGEDREILWNLSDLDFLTAAELDRDPTLSLEEARKKAIRVHRGLETENRRRSRSNARYRDLIDPTPLEGEGDFFRPWSWVDGRRK